MKVLLINNFHYYKGGSETVYFNMAKILQKYGHEVIFFSMQHEKNISCDQKSYFPLSPDKLSKIKGGVRYFYNYSAKKNLEKLIQREKPDIAHVHLFWGGISPSIFSVLKKYDIPLVHTAHDYRLVCPAYLFRNGEGELCEICQGKHFWHCITNRCSKGSYIQSFIMTMEMYFRNILFNPFYNFDGIIFVSEFSRNKHWQFFPKLRSLKTIVLYNYTPLGDKNYIKPNNEGYFLFLGRLSFEKGITTLINAFLTIPDIPLKIVGNGPEENFLKEKIKNEKLNNIELCGYKIGEELANIISKASFVIVPSICYENNPMSIIEAYSLGVPVIGTNLGGIPEIIVEGETGFTFSVNNYKELQDCIYKAFHLEKNKYEKMCQNARNFAVKYFSEEQYINKLNQFYCTILNKK